MKKSFLYIISFTLFFVIGCEENDEDFLTRTPHTPSDFDHYTTPTGAEQGIAAAYHVMQRGEETERVEFIGTIRSGDAMCGGEPGGNDQPFLQEAMRFNTTTTNTFVRQLWSVFYRGIYRCNMVIGYLSEPIDNFPEDQRTRILGEAYFLRALFHFKLQVIYGGMPQMQGQFNNQLKGIPYNDHVLKQDEWYPNRPELNETWEKIEADFVMAASLLPEKSQYSDADMGRATKGAANAMLAKTYLYQEKWQQAYDAAKIVINSGEYWLEGDDAHPGPFTVTRTSKDGNVDVQMPGYKWIWQPEANNSGGSVFSVQHWQDNSNSTTGGGQGNILPQYMGPRQVMLVSEIAGDGTFTYTSTQYYWGFILPTRYFIETAFEDIGCEVNGEIVDPRYKISVMEPTDSVPYDYADATIRAAAPDSVTLDPYFNMPCTGYMTWKYFPDPIWVANRATWHDNPHNTKYVRFADVLLIGAEAAAQIGQNTDALSWINWVRQRARNAGNTGYPQDLTGTVTKEQVWAERRVELAFEGHQFYDLIRTGRAQQVLKTDAMQYPITEVPDSDVTGLQQFGDNFEPNKDELWPIPQAEVDNTNGSIGQNPGWE